MKPGLVSALKNAGLLPVLWGIRRSVLGREDRRARLHEDRFRSFQSRYGPAVAHRFLAPGSRRRALIVSIEMPGVEVELGLVKAVEMAGFQPVVLMGLNEWLMKYYALTGIRDFYFWDEFIPELHATDAEALLKDVHTTDDLLEIRHNGVNVGRYAVSTALRYTRTGSLDITSKETRSLIQQYLLSSMRYAAAAERILSIIQPEFALFVDRGYTPHAELFDACMSRGIDTATWNAAHRNNRIMLKRYTAESRNEHPSSLSDSSWNDLKTLPWSSGQREELYHELYTAYATGEWYGEVGTQVNKRMIPSAELRQRFKLDAQRPTAIIFPHMFWDATFFWGRDLFSNYEEWFVRAVQAACANPHVNWLIKIHPANTVKNIRDGYTGECSELAAIRTHIGSLPPHISLIPTESDVNTFSLFDIMDWCLTVRGTIGIEAASFGIPVLTAGTGRYDRRGFTIDSDSCSEYLGRLANIQNIARLTAGERELAEKFAHAVFMRRPLELKTVTLEYAQDSKATLSTRINAVTREDWLAAPDIRSLSAWIADGHQADFLSSL